MTNQKKIFISFLISFLLTVFSSCSQERQFNLITIENWEMVEEAYFQNDSEEFISSLKIFEAEFLKFQDSREYEVIKHLDTDIKIFDKKQLFTDITNTIHAQIDIIYSVPFYSQEMAEAVYKIRACLFEIQKITHKNSITSIKYYVFILTTLILFILLLSTFLYLVTIKYEKESEDLEELDIYSQIMIDGIEKERKRIAKEIHDTVIQDIKVIQMEGDAVDFSQNEDENLQHINKIKMLTDSSIKQLRTLCKNLTPKEVKTSIITILEHLCILFMENSQLKLNLKIQDDIRTGKLTVQQNLHIYRIVHEALSNIKNHAQAKNVSVLIRNKEVTEDGKNQLFLMIFIMDDGVGFDVEEKSLSSSHFGLRNMEERAKLIGGKLDIISDIGEGTEITLEVPLYE